MEILSELHPRAVHFPIAFFVLYFIFETVGILLKKDYLSKSALIILFLGLISAVMAVLTGNQAFEVVKNLEHNSEKSYLDIVGYHELFATISIWFFTSLFFFRVFLTIKKKLYTNHKYLIIIFALIGCGLIFITGYYGGILVYEYGMGTKLFSK